MQSVDPDNRLQAIRTGSSSIVQSSYAKQNRACESDRLSPQHHQWTKNVTNVIGV